MTATAPRLAAVVAIADNGVIGRDGDLPWRMKSDLKWFKSVTLGKPIIMGRITWESLGRPLPGRLNIVVTRSRIAPCPHMVVAASPADAARIARAVAAQDGVDEACVIGGAHLYADMLPDCDRLYLTRVHGDVVGDRHLHLSSDGWDVQLRHTIDPGPEDDFPATVEQWDRIRP